MAAERWESADRVARGDYARCAEVTRRSSSNFYYAFMLLPAERRRALHAVYAFCRFIDDIADDERRSPTGRVARTMARGTRNASSAARRLARSRARSPTASRRFNIPRRYFEEVIAGVEMDLTRKRYANFDELRLYCYRVASAVGLICIEIFGYRNPRRARLRREARHRLPADQHPARRAARMRPAAGFICRSKISRASASVEEENLATASTAPRFERLMEFEAIARAQFYPRPPSARCPPRIVRRC